VNCAPAVEMDRKKFQERLLAWWADNQRDYPWRKTTDPYHLLVAEFLLHRTRADQVVPLYIHFLQTYPHVEDLAEAQLSDVREVLASAGLMWRVDMLLDCARAIVDRFGGQIPESSTDLQTLPGIGHYKAAAIRCFAFGYGDAVIDTNTVRIASRLIGFTVTDGSRRSILVHRIVQDLIDPERARALNFALLDFGALVCRSVRPLCVDCPLLELCEYGQAAIGQSVLSNLDQ
jgi:A/G-specific adenine glycosylase